MSKESKFKCNRCPQEIGKLESYLVYNDKKYCKDCIVWMIFENNSLPNDGSVRGGQLAQALSLKKTWKG